MPTPPPGWLRRVYALPKVFYRSGLGRFLGHRFLQLTHTGRKSGRTYQTVLEVVRYDVETGEAFVVAGYGKGSDWLRNIRAGGPTWIDFGRGRQQAVYRDVSADEAVRVFAAYERRYRLFLPIVRRVLSSLAGFDYRGSDADRRRTAERLPMLALRPRNRSGS